MSREVDSRVVELQFDNSNFEKNTKETMSTIDKLMEKLKFKGAEEGFEDLTKSAGKVDFSGIQEGLEVINSKFSAMNVMATTIFMNIANDAYRTGKRLVESLSIDQVTSGWDKYIQKTGNVKTIMNATGKSIDKVDKYLNKLMWYSDETSFSFSDMTSALGTMTAAGGDIDKLIPMIEGMANATAYAGKGASEFSRVIYNLNQSYSQGYLSLMDWKSVNLAGVATKELKQQLIDTGVALGTIKEGQVTISNFDSSLSDKWATAEVMEQGFTKFAEMTEAAYDLVEAGEYDTASEAIEALSGQYSSTAESAFKAAQEAKSFTEAIDATKDAVSSEWLKIFEDIFGNQEEATVLWTELANRFWDIFASPLDDFETILSDALKGGWKNFLDISGLSDSSDFLLDMLEETAKASGKITEEMIEKAGGFEELLGNGWLTGNDLEKTLDTAIQYAESYAALDDVSLEVKGIDRDVIESQLEVWKQFKKELTSGKVSITEIVDKINRPSGRNNLAQSLWNVMDAIGSVTEPIKEAWTDIFGAPASESIYQLTVKLRDFTASLTLSNETSEKVKRTFSGIFSVLSAIADVFKGLWSLLKPVVKLLSPIFDGILDITAAIGDFLTGIYTTVSASDAWSSLIKGFANILSNLGKGFDSALGAGEKFGEFITGFFKAITPGMMTVGNGLENWVKNVGTAFSSVNFDSDLFKNIYRLMSLGMFSNFTKSGTGLFDSLKGGVESITKLPSKVGDSVKDFLSPVSEALDAWTNGSKAETLLSIAKAIGILALSIFALSMCDTEKILGSITALMVSLVGLVAVYNTISNVGSVKSNGKGIAGIFSGLFGGKSELASLAVKAGSLVLISSSVLILAGALAVISTIDTNKLVTSVTALGVIMAMLTVTMLAMNRFSKKTINVTAGFVGMALGIRIIVGALEPISKMSDKNIYKGLLTILGLLGSMALVLSYSNGGAFKGSAFVLVAASILIVTEALKSIADIPLDQLTNALEAVIIVLGATALALTFMQGGVLKAAAILIVAAALNVLTAAMESMAAMSTGDLIKSLLGVASVLGVIVGMAFLLTLNPLMMATLAEIAAAVFLIGAGIAMINLAQAANSLTSILNVFDEFNSRAVIALIESFVKMLTVDLIVGIADGLVEVSDSIITGVATIIGSVCDAIILCAPKIEEALCVLIELVCNVLQKEGPLIFETIGGLIGDLWDAISPALDDLWNNKLKPWLDDIVTQIKEELNPENWFTVEEGGAVDRVTKDVEALVETVNGTRKVMTMDPIIQNGDLNVLEKAREIFLSLAIPDYWDDTWSKYVEVGENAADGLAEGVTNNAQSAVDAQEQMASRGLEKTKEVYRTNSPSREMYDIGNYVVQGLANGVKENQTTFIDAMIALAQAGDNAFRNYYGIHSPSMLGEEEGENIGMGLKQGLNQSREDFVAEALKLGKCADEEFCDYWGITNEEISSVAWNHGWSIVNGVVVGIDENLQNAIDSSFRAGQQIRGAFDSGFYGSKSGVTGLKLSTDQSWRLTADEFDKLDEKITTKKYSTEEIAAAQSAMPILSLDGARDYLYEHADEIASQDGSTAVERIENLFKSFAESLLPDEDIDPDEKLKTSGSGSSTKKTAAEKIKEQHEAALELLETKAEVLDAEYDLWKAENEDTASAEELTAKMDEHAQAAINAQKDYVAELEAQYNELVGNSEVTEQEKLDAKSDLLSAKETLAKLTAERYEGKYEQAIADIESKQDLADAEYELWTAQNEKTATDIDKNNREIAYINDELTNQTEIRDKALETYNELSEQLGADSRTTQEAYIEYLKQEQKAQELQNELLEQQLENFDLAIEEIEKMEELYNTRHSMMSKIYDDGDLSNRKSAYESAYSEHGTGIETIRANNTGTLSAIMAVDSSLKSMSYSFLKLNEERDKLAYAKENNLTEEAETAEKAILSEKSALVDLFGELADGFGLEDSAKSAMMQFGYAIADNYDYIKDGMSDVWKAVNESEIFKDTAQQFSALLGPLLEDETQLSNLSQTAYAGANLLVSLQNQEWGEAAASMLNFALSIGKVVKQAGGLQQLVTWFKSAGSAVKSFAGILQNGQVAEGVSGVVKTLGTLAGGEAGGGILASITSGLSGIGSSALAAFESLGPIAWAITAIVAAFAALTAIFWDKDKSVLENLGEGLKQLFYISNPIGWIMALFDENSLFNKVKEKLKTFFGNLGRSMKEFFSSGIGNVIKQIFYLINPIGMLLSLFDENSLLRKFYDWAINLGKNIVSGIANGIKGFFSGIWDAIKSVGQGIINGFKSLFGIHSPSTVMAEMGGYIGAGFSEGISASANGVTETVDTLSNSAISVAEEAMAQANDILNNPDNLDPTISPVVDLTSAEEGASWLNSLFGTTATSKLNVSRSAEMATSVGNGRKNQNGVSEAVASGTETSNADVITAINALGDRMDGVGNSIRGMQVTINSKQLVGSIVNDMDNELGRRSRRMS